MQNTLFDDNLEKITTQKELVITGINKQILSKQQKDFNRLIKKIEKLRSELKSVSETLDGKIQYYSVHIHPLEQKTVDLNIKKVKLIFPFYKDKKPLNKTEKEVLAELITIALNDIFYFSKKEPDDEIKEIFKAMEGISYEESKKVEFEDMKMEMEEKFEEMGFDVNMDDFNENMTEEEIMRKMGGFKEDFEKQAKEKEEKKAGRKKSKKAEEREEKRKQIEDARKMNISSIYKQMVKAFHPDLEIDPERKLEKEEIMKLLTVAYEKNDLHTLLRLEIEWMHKEENDPAKLSNEKLSLYNEALKEQVYEMEMQVQMLQNHPRFMPLQRFAQKYWGMDAIDMEREKRDMLNHVKGIEESNELLSGPGAVRHLKEVIRDYSRYSRMNNLDLDALFKSMERF